MHVAMNLNSAYLASVKYANTWHMNVYVEASYQNKFTAKRVIFRPIEQLVIL